MHSRHWLYQHELIQKRGNEHLNGYCTCIRTQRSDFDTVWHRKLPQVHPVGSEYLTLTREMVTAKERWPLPSQKFGPKKILVSNTSLPLFLPAMEKDFFKKANFVTHLLRVSWPCQIQPSSSKVALTSSTVVFKRLTRTYRGIGRSEKYIKWICHT